MFDPEKAHYLVVTGIVIKDGRYLLTRRSEKEKVFPGKWTVPGGKLEMQDYTKRPKDTDQHWYNVFEHVVRREVKEEAGIDIKNIRYLTSLSFIRPDNIPVVVVSLFADHAAGSVRLSEDMTDHAWVTLEEAKDYDLISGIYEELEMLDAHLKGAELGVWKKK